MPKDDRYLDPTDSVAVPRKSAPRPTTLDGKVVTLLDISKAKGDHLLDRIEELLRERTAPKAILRRKKPTFARPAPDDLRQQILRRATSSSKVWPTEGRAQRAVCTTACSSRIRGSRRRPLFPPSS